jgi:DinB superfamily
MAASSRKSASEKLSADASLRQHMIELLKGGNAHVGFLDALETIPKRKRGAYAKGLPHTAWQLLEHLRIAQWDILEFSSNPKHVSPEFPVGYWPSTPAPHDDDAWNKSIRSFRRDQRAMMRLVSNKRINLHAQFPWGDGQTLLREALLVADHNAYHLGQLVDLRRALGIWAGS